VRASYFEVVSLAAFFSPVNCAFDPRPTVLCKIVGVYQIGYHNRVTGKRTMEQVAVMQNIFYGKKIIKTFDLKGSLKGRFARLLQSVSARDSTMESETRRRRSRSTETGSDSEFSGDDEYISSDNEDESPVVSVSATLLDGDFLEFTSGRPLPLTDRAKAVFHMSVLNVSEHCLLIGVLCSADG
jgi:1-phosphatidylinositol-3-phosphate 5-kinase